MNVNSTKDNNFIHKIVIEKTWTSTTDKYQNELKKNMNHLNMYTSSGEKKKKKKTDKTLRLFIQKQLAYFKQ